MPTGSPSCAAAPPIVGVLLRPSAARGEVKGTCSTVDAPSSRPSSPATTARDPPVPCVDADDWNSVSPLSSPRNLCCPARHSQRMISRVNLVIW
jgi:hypothetical protein